MCGTDPEQVTLINVKQSAASRVFTAARDARQIRRCIRIGGGGGDKRKRKEKEKK